MGWATANAPAVGAGITSGIIANQAATRVGGLAGGLNNGVVITNPVPATLARVFPGEATYPTLGPPGRADVFVTNPAAIRGLTPAQISDRLTIPPSASFTVVEFPSPSQGIASPVFRTDPGFVGGGRTAGGAPEFVIPNGPIPAGATTTIVRPAK
jgi:hypothetical protein